MKRAPEVIVGFLLVLAIVLLWRTEGQRDTARAEGHRLRARVDSLEAVQGRVDTVYTRDTLRLWRTLTHYDSVRTTDTLTRNDTVFVPRVVADEAVAECRATVLTCEQRVAVRDSINATLSALNASTERRLRATERKARRDNLVWLGAGLALGWLWPR